jgi:hypothetical protein
MRKPADSPRGDRCCKKNQEASRRGLLKVTNEPEQSRELSSKPSACNSGGADEAAAEQEEGARLGSGGQAGSEVDARGIATWGSGDSARLLDDEVERVARTKAEICQQQRGLR